MGIKSVLKGLYETKYKAVLLVTLLLIPAAFGILLYSKATTGEYFQKGVSLKGGDTYTIPVDQYVPVESLQDRLSSRLPNADLTVRGISEFGRLTGITIEVADATEEEVISSLRAEGIRIEDGSYSKESIGASLGASFFQQLTIAIIFAFLFMAIVVFITFRSLLPSMFVILAVFSTILQALAVTSLIGIKLSTAGIAAFLMLIGYSVDTDILLTTRVLRRKEGAVMDRVYSALKTGITMTLTALVTVTLAYFLTDSEVIKQIMLILTIGLVFDLINTWVQNVGIIRWYLERKERARNG